MTQNRRIKVEFSEQGLSSKIPKPKFFLGQLVEVKDENNEEYLITGITLNYSKDSYPMWEYHVGTSNNSPVQLSFKENLLIPKVTNKLVNKQIPIFRFTYYILVCENDKRKGYWNGINWTMAKYEAKHYLSWAAASSAQYQLRHNSYFRDKKAHIEAVFKP